MLLDDLIRQARLKTTNTKYASKASRDAFYQRQAWRNKRKDILKRDNNECQITKSTGGVYKGRLVVHHIKPLEYFPDLAMDDSNLITVAHHLHNIIHEVTVPKFQDEWW